jgi:hypothetical protein
MVGTPNIYRKCILWRYSVNPAGARLAGFLFTETPDITTHIRTANAMLGFQYDVSETIKIAFSGGAQYNEVLSPSYRITTDLRLPNGVTRRFPAFDQAIPASSRSTLSDVISAKASKRFESSDIGFDYSKTVSPNINGVLITYERYSLNGSHQWSPTLRTSLGLSYTDNLSPLAPGSLGFERQYFAVSPSLNWRWTENLDLNAVYSWTQASDPAAGSLTAESHAGYLYLQYTFDQHKF